MAPSLAAKKTVLFHLLNFNLLMDLGKDPPGPTNPLTPTIPTPIEQCHQVYGQTMCFSLQPPWVGPSRPVVRPPQAPEEIGTTFSLFTRQNYTVPVPLDPSQLSTILGAPFVPDQPFKVISHGYFSHGAVAWAKTLKGEMLRADDQNVIVVDWSVGAMPPYTQGVANLRLVGAQLAYLIYSLNKYGDVPVSAFHLIGHSLGAHLSGQAATVLRDTYGLQVPRITGLDPAEPYFNDTHPITRLETSDATFVDVIHTDDSPILGFPLSIGMTQPIGHLDFYPNGGSQPGCENGAINCHHTRAITYFTESIRQSCPLIATVCPSYQKFLDGECWGCDSEHPCSRMGLAAVPLPVPQRTSLYLETRARSPHCGYHYRVSLKVSNTSEARQHLGEFAITHIKLQGHKDYSPVMQLSSQSHYYEADTTHRRVILTRDVGKLQTVTLHFEDPTWLLPRFS
ncbi:Pancreatic lipase-related protein 2 [Chionoecetes opilio]|uniref:Pancreatic lipase-related protein 2 n=1 Tax=Chionoecetes opilio TaxID=41210 RepID=A0A8J4YC13_CHIOP|nr:Pancreatic lipase-related protein 2 [Chionoecetes opilio]